MKSSEVSCRLKCAKMPKLVYSVLEDAIESL